MTNRTTDRATLMQDLRDEADSIVRGDDGDDVEAAIHYTALATVTYTADALNVLRYLGGPGGGVCVDLDNPEQPAYDLYFEALQREVEDALDRYLMEVREQGERHGEGIADGLTVHDLDEWDQWGEDDEDAIRDALSDYLHEAEDHARSYSPFEFVAQTFNASPYADEVWEAFDEGTADAFERAIDLAVGDWEVTA